MDTGVCLFVVLDIMFCSGSVKVIGIFCSCTRGHSFIRNQGLLQTYSCNVPFNKIIGREKILKLSRNEVRAVNDDFVSVPEDRLSCLLMWVYGKHLCN